LDWQKAKNLWEVKNIKKVVRRAIKAAITTTAITVIRIIKTRTKLRIKRRVKIGNWRISEKKNFEQISS
jgi:hypothetical protein